eukprot:jgi/Bigna1/86010/estExt_fgenesh1_pg.C_70247
MCACQKNFCDTNNNANAKYAFRTKLKHSFINKFTVHIMKYPAYCFAAHGVDKFRIIHTRLAPFYISRGCVCYHLPTPAKYEIMSFWAKKLKDMRPLGVLKYVKPSELVMGVDRTLVSVCTHAKNNGVARTLFPGMVAIGTLGVAVEWILCAERHNIAKYH